MSDLSAGLYVVATPIGNLDDWSPRARQVLSQVDLIAAEDTRHSAKLLHHFSIRTPLTSLHEHNEREQVPRLIEALRAGKSIALISDAGTPLVADPGFRLVRAARAAGIRLIPVPGPCAAVTALSVAGLPSDRFVFEGFPPARAVARREAFRAQANETRTIIYYESAHRILESLADMAQVFGRDRPAVVARELTKTFESLYDGDLEAVCERITADPEQQRGEFVVLIQGAELPNEPGHEAERVLRLLLGEVPMKQAVTLAAKITGGHKNALYREALRLTQETPED